MALSARSAWRLRDRVLDLPSCWKEATRSGETTFWIWRRAWNSMKPRPRILEAANR